MSWTFNPFTGKFDYHVDLTSHAADTDAHHAQSHNVASHSDTTATGAELETLTDNSIADALHRHSELVASDGSPDPALSVDATGNVDIGGTSDGKVGIETSANDDYTKLITAYAPNLTTGKRAQINFGQSGSGGNAAEYRFYYAGNGAAGNRLDFGFWGDVAPKFSCNRSGNVGINTTSPDTKLQVVGDCKFGDDNTNYASFATDGELTLIGTARVGSDLFVGPTGIRAPLARPATWTDHGISGAWQFADGAEETLVINFRVPHRMDRTVAPYFHIKWSADGVSPGNCEWQVEYLYRAPNEDTTAAAQDTETIVVAASATANGLVNSDTLGLDLPSATDVLLQVRLTRLAGVGNDTIADTVELHGFTFHFTSNKLGEAT